MCQPQWHVLVAVIGKSQISVFTPFLFPSLAVMKNIR
jgi:hypothetical protein